MLTLVRRTITPLPVESEGGLQGDDLLLLRHVQDVPQVDGGADHHGASSLQNWKTPSAPLALTLYTSGFFQRGLLAFALTLYTSSFFSGNS